MISDNTVSVDLGRRAKPRQKRAQQRIDSIIATTMELLDDTPVEAITTSAVAKAADIPVGTVYRYFPNIYAVFGAIFDHFQEKMTEILTLADTRLSGGWKSVLETNLSGMSQLLHSRPAYRAVVLLTFSTPELLPIREKWNSQFADGLASVWRDGADGFTGDPDIVARMVVEMFSAAQLMILRNWDDVAKREKIETERMVALESYLTAHLK